MTYGYYNYVHMHAIAYDLLHLLECATICTILLLHVNILKIHQTTYQQQYWSNSQEGVTDTRRYVFHIRQHEPTYSCHLTVVRSP